MANSLTSPFYVPALIVALVVIPFLKDRADRERITRQIEANGGTVMEITKVWTFGNRYERTYEVSYTTASGKGVTATCRTNMNGVHWISDLPPDR
jgi:hypothetical protein